MCLASLAFLASQDGSSNLKSQNCAWPKNDEVVCAGVDVGPQLIQGNETVSHTSTQHQLVLPGCSHLHEEPHELVTGWQTPGDSLVVVVRSDPRVVVAVAAMVVADADVPKWGFGQAQLRGA